MRHAERASVVLLILAVAIGLAVTSTFAIGRAYRSLVHPTADFPDRPAFVSAPDPILRATKGVDPNATDVAPGVPRPDLRTIEVFTGRINLSRGGQVTRSIPLSEPVRTPQDIVERVGDPSWISAPTPDEVMVGAALIMRPGTTLVSAAPLRRITLRADPGVFLGGLEATLSFKGVDVEASDRSVPLDGEVGAGNRPFVVAQGGTMEITDSTFRYLGRDWNDSYGVSWTRGATGFAVGSTFDHNFMGMFVATAIDVRFDHNTVRDNVLFGLCAYQVSAGMLVTNNLVEGNGRIGIILSDHVTGTELRNNTVQHNGLDGIMMIGSADRNTVSGNLADSNGGDGIVVSSSAGDSVERNWVRDNRVAISVYGNASHDNVVSGNVIDDNGLAVQGVDAGGNTVLSNGDYWRPGVLILIWVTAALFVIGMLWLTARSKRSQVVTTVRVAVDERQRTMSGALR